MENANSFINVRDKESPQQKANLFFSKQTIVKGTIWLSLITIATLAVIFLYTHGYSSLKALTQIKYTFILPCFGMLFIDLMLGSWRNHIFIRKLYPNVSHWVSFQANVSNMFMGAVTPAHGGAGPAQIYIYMRNGVSFLNAFTVTLINYGATLIFMPLAGLAAILLMNSTYVEGIIPSLLQYGFSFFSVFLLAFLLCFWKPLWIGFLLQKLTAFLAVLLPRKKQALFKWNEKTFSNIQKYQHTCSLLLKKHPGLFPLSLLITIVLYLNKYCMQYFILLGLGVETDILQVIAIQVLIQFMIYFAPSPGGSGFAELSISILFGKIVPSNMVAAFTLLQRSFLLFFPSIIGAVTILKHLNKQAMEVKSNSPQTAPESKQ